MLNKEIMFFYPFLVCDHVPLSYVFEDVFS